MQDDPEHTQAEIAGAELFTGLLFREAQDEVRQRYGETQMAEIAHAALTFMLVKPPGIQRIRFVQVVAYGSVSPQPTTIIEIVNDDMPFLVDSVMGEVQARDIPVRLVLHPIFKTRRGADGRLAAIAGPGDRNWRESQESYIQIHLDAVSDELAEEIVRSIEAVLGDVRLAVDDWRAMLDRLGVLLSTYKANPPPVSEVELRETLAFLEWLVAGNFTFLGMRELDLVGPAETGDLATRPERGLGILRNPNVRVLRRGNELTNMTPEVRRFYFQPAALIISKANALSRVHRRVHMDYVGAKIYGPSGQIAGELRMVGLFTSAAYTRSVREIPFLRHKIERVLAASGFPPDSHNGKAIANIVETFPRDELFQIDVDTLRSWATAVLDLDLRPRLRALYRVDEFDRFVSVLVYTPRDRYTSDVRVRTGELLARVFAGRIAAFYPFFPEGPLVRTHYIVARFEGATPKPTVEALEAEIGLLTQSWQDRLAGVLRERGIDGEGPALAERFGAAFSGSYRETFDVDRALQDLERIARLSDAEPVAIDFYPDAAVGAGKLRAAIYRLDVPIPLSDRVPVLENLGFRVIDERSFEISPRSGGKARKVLLHDMVLQSSGDAPLEFGRDDERLERCFLAVARGEADNDGFNRLVNAAGLEWWEAAVMRAYGAYLRQLRSPFTPAFLADTLEKHHAITRDLWSLFRRRFDPDLPADTGATATAEIAARVERDLAAVSSLEEDRVLRHFLNLIGATVRTNVFLHGESGGRPTAIAFKLRSGDVDGMPEPKPFAEIWVYSPRVEGVHMRFAPIARGGLRWSDRAQDFRTEVLGLVKAQQVKNTVIVPQGAKGGFVPKRLPARGSRDEVMQEGIAAYEVFVSTLLALTDNYQGNAVVPPPRTLRHDGDDPYLVVAADKGTATFSDFANAIAVRHGFWLGDAFASGGSAGYDHKKMAITARGAWECVKRHFREIDVDIQAVPFRVIGVGDMSGDVFGNGMLLSRTTRLVAAFDHRDIFIDPDPDPVASFEERKRLFELPRSSWQDYDRAKLSAGGGVFSRSAKSIALSPECRAMLGLASAEATPQQVMRAILKADADLLWFGGIGTYVKATAETDEQAGDRANDAIRINGAELRVKVIGEGANLGLTQRGRIEFARRGGRLNTDFIDNSAGVNSSDQEVNIKIAFGAAIAAGKIDIAGRNRILSVMTDEVAEACLANNYRQSLALSLGQSRGLVDLGFQQRTIRDLEDAGLLDRGLEVLPTDSQIAERMKAGEPLTRPELAVLLSYAKIDLSRQLLASRLPDDPYFRATLVDYFPDTLGRQFPAEVAGHRLAREIVATTLTNAIVNRGGSTIVARLTEETGHSAPNIAAAFAVVDAVYGIDRLWRSVDALDNRVSGRVQLGVYRDIQDLVRRQTSWFLRKVRLSDGLQPIVARFGAGIETYRRRLPALLTERQRAGIAPRHAELVAAGISDAFAREIAAIGLLAAGSDITAAAAAHSGDVEATAATFFAVGDHFRLGEIRAAADALQLNDTFERIAVNSTLAGFADAQRAIAEAIMAATPSSSATLAAWLDRHGAAAARAKASLDGIADGGVPTLARLSVAAAQLRDLVAL